MALLDDIGWFPYERGIVQSPSLWLRIFSGRMPWQRNFTTRRGREGEMVTIRRRDWGSDWEWLPIGGIPIGFDIRISGRNITNPCDQAGSKVTGCFWSWRDPCMGGLSIWKKDHLVYIQHYYPPKVVEDYITMLWFLWVCRYTMFEPFSKQAFLVHSCKLVATLKYKENWCLPEPYWSQFESYRYPVPSSKQISDKPKYR